MTLNLWSPDGFVQAIGALHLFIAPRYDAPAFFHESLTVQTLNSICHCNMVCPGRSDGLVPIVQ